jgi:pantothenate kinase
MDQYAAIDIGGTLAKISFIASKNDKDKYPHLDNMTI